MKNALHAIAIVGTVWWVAAFAVAAAWSWIANQGRRYRR